MCLKDATQQTCLALNGEIWVLHAFYRQPQVKHVHNTINWPTEDMSHNVWSRFTTRIHVLRHLHWWLILHCLSKVTLWYYITPSAVIVEELNLVEASYANTHKWLQMSKLALTSSLPEAPQMPRKSGRGSQKSQLVVHISLLLIHQKTQLHIAHWANCSTQDKQTDAARAKKKKQAWRTEAARQVERQRCKKCSCFYLQRRHDIPCPLKPATERCSPCSCCRRPSLAIPSTAKRRAARNPIGLTDTAS